MRDRFAAAVEGAGHRAITVRSAAELLARIRADLSRIDLLVANAEAIPAPDNSVDAVTSIFVVHELPPAIRSVVTKECARVLKPGGRLVLLDSLQRGHEPAYDGLLERFPQNLRNPTQGGQGFRRKADSNPMIADSR